MTLFRCTVQGIQPSGRRWSFRAHFNSALAVNAVQGDWNSAINGAWTGGASALQALFPTGTIVELTKTEELAVVAVTSPRFTGDKLFAAVQSTNTVSLPGTGVGDSSPDQNSILVSLRTPETGRTNRGRLHLPAPLDSIVTAGEIDATSAGHVTTAITGILTNMASGGNSWVLPTYKIGHTGLPVGRTINVSSVLTDRVVRTQRKRVKRRLAVYV